MISFYKLLATDGGDKDIRISRDILDIAAARVGDSDSGIAAFALGH